MALDTQVTISFIFSMVTCLVALYTIWSNSKKDTKIDTRESLEAQRKSLEAQREVAEGTLKANIKLDELCNTTRETRLDIRTLSNKIDEIKEKQIEHEIRLKTVEQDLKDLHNEQI